MPDTSTTALVLASASQRRQELLRQLGVNFVVLATDIDEMPHPRESPAQYVQRMAAEKARAAVAELRSTYGADRAVLAADTTVVCAGKIMGKPQDEQAAADFLRLLSGRSHEVLSAVCVADREVEQTLLQISRVWFIALTDEQIQRYIDTGEPFGKAGGYAIQGRAAAFIEHLEGSYSSVMGLPLAETANLLRKIKLMPY